MRALIADRLMAAGLVVFTLFCGRAAVAQEAGQTWQVGKATGEVWVVSNGVQNASLTSNSSLNFGDSIRTGRTGRVLLKRGEETIMIAPNSVVGIPAETKPGSTNIVQQAGSILLEVNKRDARTFEVETPYLVAAVKGTQFRVTVGAKTSDVTVQHGSVEVSDSKTGKIALVLPGQSATVSALAGGGLSLHGQGALSPIRNGTPRASSIDRVPVPRNGLAAPSSLRAGLQTRPLAAATIPRAHPASSGLRIAVPIGQVRLNVHAATNGLAGEVTAPGTARRAVTIWSSNGASAAGSSGVVAISSPTVVTGAGATVTPPSRVNAPGDLIGAPTVGSTIAYLPSPAGGPARPGALGSEITGPYSAGPGSAGPGSLPGPGPATVGLGNGGITIGNGIVTVTSNGGGNGKGNNGNGNGNGGGNGGGNGSNAGGNGNGNGGQGNSGNGNSNSGNSGSNSGSSGNSNGNNGNAYGVGNGNGGGNGQGNNGNGNGNGGSIGRGR